MAQSRSAGRWRLTGALLGAGLLASGCSSDDLPRFGWPEGVTDRAKASQHFWSWAALAALFIGVIVWGLMFWAFIVYRKRKNSPLYPKQTKENVPLELVYTVVPFVMVAVLFYFEVTTESYVLKTEPNPAVKISVVAQKWAWDFGYDGTQSPDGPGTIHTVGTSTEVPVLILPENKVVDFGLESKDVIHSFWVVDFLFKRDVFPYPTENNTVNHIQMTLERTGSFVGRCAELCGTYHQSMNFEVRSVPQNIYDAYLKTRAQKDPATGVGYTTAAALTAVGKQFKDCGDLCAPLATTTYPLNPNRTARSASEPQQQAGG